MKAKTKTLMLGVFLGLILGYFIFGNTELINQINQKVSEQTSEQGLEGFVTVQRVVDGDTFVTDEGVKVRLIGVDTPETVKRGTKPEPYGKEASDFTKATLTGKKVKLVYDKEQYDRYKRELAYVYLEDGTFFNRLLVQKGLADTMEIKPNIKYADTFNEDKKVAQENKLGMWATEEAQEQEVKEPQTSKDDESFFDLIMEDVEKYFTDLLKNAF